jgi:hypothetical protein
MQPVRPDPAELPVRQVRVPDFELDKPGAGRLISFNVTALEFARVSENLSVPKIQEHKQVALPISMHKHLSRAAFNIRLARYT